MKEKHRKENKKLKWYILIIILLILIFFTVYYFIVKQKEGKMLLSKENIEQVNIVENIIQEEIPKITNTLPVLNKVEVNMPEKTGKYRILGEIEIPKINVKKYIIDEASDESIKVSVAKFWGPNIHESGNFSIIGHNYKKHFGKLKYLEKGDTFTITSKDGFICTYEVYDSFIVEPDDMKDIEDTLNGQREVTLITCSNGGTKRLIVKAKGC